MEKKTMRQKYLDGEITFEEYYLSLGQCIGIGLDDRVIEEMRKKEKRGSLSKYINSLVISLMAFNGGSVRECFKSHGDFYSFAGVVCIYKVLYKQSKGG